jgi:hypothetical protein
MTLHASWIKLIWNSLNSYLVEFNSISTLNSTFGLQFNWTEENWDAKGLKTCCEYGVGKKTLKKNIDLKRHRLCFFTWEWVKHIVQFY